MFQGVRYGFGFVGGLVAGLSAGRQGSLVLLGALADELEEGAVAAADELPALVSTRRPKEASTDEIVLPSTRIEHSFDSATYFSRPFSGPEEEGDVSVETVMLKRLGMLGMLTPSGRRSGGWMRPARSGVRTSWIWRGAGSVGFRLTRPPTRRSLSAMDREEHALPPTASDAELVERLKAGDDAAYETLVRVHGPRMLSVARRYFPQEADAQDALQDAFLHVVKGIHTFEGQSKLSTWLHRVVANAALMRIRSRTRRPEEPTAPPALQGLADGRMSARPWDLTPSAILSDKDLRDRVRSCVDRLPEGYRIVVCLKDIQGIDVDEVGRLLGLTRSTVRIRLHRGRQALREMLRDAFDKAPR